jgi:hypothetical protein
MNQLTPTEIATAQQLLQNYAPAETALAHLTESNGDLAAAFDRLSNQQPEIFTEPNPNQSLWETTITVLRQELCSDEGWRGKVKEYSKNPTSAPLLTGLIVHLVSSSHLQLDPGIATFIVLYVSKIGLDIFCEHIKPDHP